MRIYVASSWRSYLQPTVVRVLRKAGHEVYDFRNPDQGPAAEGSQVFHWREIDPRWERWTAKDVIEGLQHPRAQAQLASDVEAMRWAEVILLVLPCGRSAHLQLGWGVGQGKHTAILLEEDGPELMYGMVDKLCVSLAEVLHWLGDLELARSAGS